MVVLGKGERGTRGGGGRTRWNMVVSEILEMEYPSESSSDPSRVQ